MKKKCIYVFMMGTPGCGKSALYKIVEGKIKQDKNSGIKDFLRLDDFPKLWNIFMTDEKTKKWQNCRKTSDGGYLVTNPGVWDIILKELNKDILKESKPGKIVFIEFARPDIVRSIAENFSGEVKKNAIVVYMDVPFEICWARNVKRHEAAVASGTDDHLVSRDEMESTYGKDDHDNLPALKIPFVVIKNSGGMKELEIEAEKLIEKIKEV